MSVEGDRRRDRPLGRSPFADTAPSIVAAMLYAGAAMVWVVAGASLPGGRWLAVHLFTLGVLTNVVLGFSQHFGRTLTRTAAQPWNWALPVANAGVLMVLVGLPGGWPWAVGGGATVVTAVVVASYARLRGMRKAALGARFVWIVRIYERAHSAFIHGALLGLLLGVGVFKGSWYVAGRVAHLHVNVLGWGGLTLLATLVFFGPTLLRTRIVDGADSRAAVGLKRGALALSAAFWLLVLSGAPGSAGTALRIGAAVALAVHAWSVTTVCRDVMRAAAGARASANRWSVIALSAWFPIAVWADAAVVASGRWPLLDAVGLIMFVGVLGQSVTAVLAYVAPMLRGRTTRTRERLRDRLDASAAVRAGAFNAGVAAVTAAALVGGVIGRAMGRVGWAGLAVVLLWLAATALSPLTGGQDPAAGTGPA